MIAGRDTSFSSTQTETGMIPSLAWPLCKDDTQIHEALHEKRKESRKREINVSPPVSPSNLNPV